MRSAVWSLELALRLMGHQPGRLLGYAGAVAGSVVLMLLQLGFMNALLESSVRWLDQFDADVVVMRSDKESYLERAVFPAEWLGAVRSEPGVAEAVPVRVDMVLWKNREDGSQRPMRLFGVPPEARVFRGEALQAEVGALGRRGALLVDAAGREVNGPLGEGSAQVGERLVEVVGTFRVGGDFEVEGNLIAGEETFWSLADPGPGEVEWALVRVEEGVSAAAVAAGLRRSLPEGATAYTAEGLRARELAYWQRRTPVGLIFSAGAALGFLVGLVICYQVLFTDVTDQLGQYAIVRAMGHPDGALTGVVVWKSLVLALGAFGLGWGVSALAHAALTEWMGLPFRVSGEQLGWVLGSTVCMGIVAGRLAMRQVLEADPAEVFG